MHKKFRNTAIAVALFIAPVAIAQPGTTSPYSLSGLGEMKYVGFVQHQTMGGVSRAFRSEEQYSIVNPASYSALRAAVYNVGFTSSYGTLRTSDESTTATDGNLNYASLAFSSPYDQDRHWGVSMGLYQLSNVGYDLRLHNDDTFNSFSLFRGDGGINTFYIGGGAELFKNFSVGLNVNHNFGYIQSVSAQIFPDTVAVFSLLDESFVRYNAFNMDFGVQYNVQGEKTEHTFGATFHTAANFRGEGYRLVNTFFGTTFESVTSRLITIDTVLYNDTLGRSKSKPIQLGLAYSLSLGKNWNIGLEYELGMWSKIINPLNDKYYNDNQRFSIGLARVPKRTDYTPGSGAKYYSLIDYRVGFRYENLYYNFFDQSLNEIGIGFGVGLPIVKSHLTSSGKVPMVNKVNVGFEYTSRGTTDNGLIQEEYYSVRLGLNFNDKWFLKRKYQ